MLTLTEARIRASFINASRKEVSDLTLPADFATTDWDAHDYFGWRDPKQPRRGYAIVDLDGEPTGILLRRAEAMPLARPQCSWCSDVQLTNEVVFYSAKRAGAAGRNGDTVGTLMCADFGCSAIVRKRPATAYIGFDVDAAREARILELRERARAFAVSVIEGASRR